MAGCDGEKNLSRLWGENSKHAVVPEQKPLNQVECEKATREPDEDGLIRCFCVAEIEFEGA